MLALSVVADGVTAGDPADPTDPDNPRVTFQGFAADDAARTDPLGSITVVRGLAETEEGELHLLGTWLVFRANLDTSVYFDQPLIVDVRLVDVGGHEASDSALVTAVWEGP